VRLVILITSSFNVNFWLFSTLATLGTSSFDHSIIYAFIKHFNSINFAILFSIKMA